MKIDPAQLTEENLAAFQKAQDNLSSSLSRLMVVVERYPELKANQNFLELQAQLEGTENRITVERMKFNESVQNYNSLIRRFPANMVAGLMNFNKKAYFQAAEGAEVAPDVVLTFNSSMYKKILTILFLFFCSIATIFGKFLPNPIRRD
jgi:LemA protein